MSASPLTRNPLIRKLAALSILLGATGPAAAFCGWRENDFRPERSHDLAALDRKGLDHGRYERVTKRGADHGEGDASITRSCFDHRLPWLQCAAVAGVLDDCVSQAILHRGEWVEGLHLHEHGHVCRSQLVDANYWRIADGLQDVVVSHGSTSEILFQGICCLCSCESGFGDGCVHAKEPMHHAVISGVSNFNPGGVHGARISFALIA